jgi:hypothetical protein
LLICSPPQKRIGDVVVLMLNISRRALWHFYLLLFKSPKRNKRWRQYREVKEEEITCLVLIARTLNPIPCSHRIKINSSP